MHFFVNWRMQVSYPEGDISPFCAGKSCWSDSSSNNNFFRAWIDAVNVLEDRLKHNCAVEIRIYAKEFILVPRPWENDYPSPVEFTVFHHRSSFAINSIERFHLGKAPIVIALEDLQQVAVVRCCGLSQVFELTNINQQPDGKWWDNPGVTATRKGRSTSIGDVLQDHSGEYFMCGTNGWEPLTLVAGELVGLHTPRFETTRHDPFDPS